MVSIRFLTTPCSGGFDCDPNNGKVARLNGNTNAPGNKQVGPSIILKVMAGDEVSIKAKYWYTGTISNNGTSVLTPLKNELISLLTADLGSIGGGKGGTYSSSEINDGATNIINWFEDEVKSVDEDLPKAFLNWMIVDEEFKKQKRMDQRGSEQVNEIYDHARPFDGWMNVKVRKNGYLYVYLSNEANMDVFFDDLQVTYKRGPVVETTDYYPFGLSIQGLTSKAVNFGGEENRYKYNGKELQNKEFSDGSGLEWEDYGARMYDNQIGRWTVVDPLSEQYLNSSPYVYVVNNPLKLIDPDGREVEAIKGGVRFTGAEAVAFFTGVQQAFRNQRKLVYHFVTEANTPNIFRHRLNAFAMGKPFILTYDPDKKRQRARRYAATKNFRGQATSGVTSLDEYPYAMTYEGGAGAAVMAVPEREQNTQSGELGWFVVGFNNLQDQDKIMVVPVPNYKPEIQTAPKEAPGSNTIWEFIKGLPTFFRRLPHIPLFPPEYSPSPVYAENK